MGRLLDLKGRLPEAERAYRSAERLNPDDPAVYIGLGQLYEMVGQRQVAARTYQKALQVAGTTESDREFAEFARKALARLSSAHVSPPDKPPSAATAGPKLAATGTGFPGAARREAGATHHRVSNC